MIYFFLPAFLTPRFLFLHLSFFDILKTLPILPSTHPKYSLVFGITLWLSESMIHYVHIRVFESHKEPQQDPGGQKKQNPRQTHSSIIEAYSVP